MSNFIAEFGGLALGFLGSGLACGFCCAGSAKGTGLAGDTERLRKVQRFGGIIYDPFLKNRFIFVQKLILGLSSSCGVSSTHGKRIL